MLFSEKLKMLRKERGYTQEELAEEINVSRQAITKWESNEGLPDIENLKQISNLFNTTIDELIKEEKEISEEIVKELLVKEMDIDHSKHFDIKVSRNYELDILANKEEKVRIEIESSNKDAFKIKVDDLYNRMDINIKNSKGYEDSLIKIYIPEKYIDEIELNSKLRTLRISDLEIEKIEYDGSLKYLIVNNSKGKIVLNTSKSDVEASYDNFDGELEVNSVNSTTRVELPKNTKYKTVLKGIKNRFVDESINEDTDNIVELNGFNSKLIFIEK